jgi:hypothetical protein
MRISLHVVSAIAATSIILSSAASVFAAPLRMAGFGGGHFAHVRTFGSFGSHPHFDHRLAGDHFRRGHGRLFGGVGLFAAPADDGLGSNYGSPDVVRSDVISSGFSGIRIVVGGGAAPLADDRDLHGDCLFHKLIYSADGRYVGQKTSRACY